MWMQALGSASRPERPRWPHALDDVLSRRTLPVLDGLRAVSVFVVIAAHFGFQAIPGDLGVSAFFVLSGFLITWLLVQEYRRTQAVSLRRFYLRRTLRIFPAYYVFVVFSVGLDTVRGHPWPPGLLASGVLYVMNYYNAVHGHPATPIAHAWSLAIEEQFYLLWPMVFLVLVRRGGTVLRVGVVSLIVAVVAWRSFLFLAAGVGPAYVYNAFDTRFDNILVGCLLAACVQQRWFARPARAAVRWATLPLVTLVLLACSRILGPPAYHYTLGFTVDALLVGLFMTQILQLFSHPLWSWLERPTVRYLGTISYPLYLYHQLGLGVGRHLDLLPVAGQFTAGVGAAIALASASYHLVERPFLALKQRYGSPRAAEPGRPSQASSRSSHDGEDHDGGDDAYHARGRGVAADGDVAPAGGGRRGAGVSGR